MGVPDIGSKDNYGWIPFLAVNGHTVIEMLLDKGKVNIAEDRDGRVTFQLSRIIIGVEGQLQAQGYHFPIYIYRKYICSP